MRIGDMAEARACLEHDLDWKYIFSKAQQHSVLLLVNRNLRQHLADVAPQPVLRSFSKVAHGCQLRTLGLTGELLRILTVFEKHQIEAIPFKGPVLALLAYGDPSLRMFADLDILIREADLTRAREVLAADGYVAEFTLTPQQERSYRKTECAIQLRHPGRDAVVELHWLLTERYLSVDISVSTFWLRCSETRIGQKVGKGACAGRFTAVFVRSRQQTQMGAAGMAGVYCGDGNIRSVTGLAGNPGKSARVRDRENPENRHYPVATPARNTCSRSPANRGGERSWQLRASRKRRQRLCFPMTP